MPRLICLLLLILSPSANAETLVYEGTEGIGQGKHIVFIAGDHEYRSEESLPMLARIMIWLEESPVCRIAFSKAKISRKFLPNHV